jgi:hypothetical protein
VVSESAVCITIDSDRTYVDKDAEISQISGFGGQELHESMELPNMASVRVMFGGSRKGEVVV